MQALSDKWSEGQATMVAVARVADQFCSTVEKVTAAMGQFNASKAEFVNYLKNNLHQSSAASYNMEKAALDQLLIGMARYLEMSQSKLAAWRESQELLIKQNELLFAAARLNVVTEPLEFTFYDAACVAARILTTERPGFYCDPCDVSQKHTRHVLH